jgi:hypothetical protein
MMLQTLTAVIHKNLREATELCLEEIPMPQVSHSFLTTFEAAHASA